MMIMMCTFLPASTSAEADNGITTEGSRIYLGGEPMDLRGVNIPQFSWSSYGDGDTAPGRSAADVALGQAINDWDCSMVRLAVDPGLYVNGGVGAGSGQTVLRTAEEYQALIDRFVTTLTDRGIAVVLDCHAYSGVYDTVVSFWDIAAPKYDGNELVIYGLLNEPISDWQTWYEGGRVTLPDGTGKDSIGLPALLDRVRAVSDNVAAIGGIDWAFDLSGIASEGFAAMAAERASALGISLSDYKARYDISAESRRGRGIILDTHIYSDKPLDWDSAIGEAAREYPILVGEYNPYFRTGAIEELNAQEKAFLQKIFRWIRENHFASTAWALGAEPFLTDHSGNRTALGEAVREFVKNGSWQCQQTENLIYQHFGWARGILGNASGGAVSYHNAFADQAYRDGKNVSATVLGDIIDGDTDTHTDIYLWDGVYLGALFALDGVYACQELRISSGLKGYPDQYRVYVSDTLEDLYAPENMVENFETEYAGTVACPMDRLVRYVAFLGKNQGDNLRIKEISLSGVKPGDIDGDGFFGAPDLTLLRRQLVGGIAPTYKSRSDLNANGEIDVCDLVRLKKYVR